MLRLCETAVHQRPANLFLPVYQLLNLIDGSVPAVTKYDKNEQITLLSQRKRAFTGRHVRVCKFWGTSKKLKTRSDAYFGLLLSICHQKPNPARKTVPLKGLSHEIDFKNFDKNLQNLT
jgi:hypothetical protein